MIQVTRLNRKPIVLNSDLIKIIEASPDTMLTLINGEKLIVSESIEEIVQLVLNYRAALLAAIACQLQSNQALQSAASLSSLDISNLASQLQPPLNKA